MVKSSRRTFLVLLSVVLVALFSGLFIRGMIVKNFQDYVEGERSALVRLISSELEESYAKNLKWDRDAAAGVVIRAMRLGLRVKLVDAHGNAVMDSEQALALLPADRASRIRTMAGFNGDDFVTEYRSYPLIIGAENAGRLDVKFLGKGRSDAFTSRIGFIVLITVLLMAVSALALVTIISRKQVGSVRKPVQTATDSKSRLNTGSPVAVQENISRIEPTLSMAGYTEEEPASMPDDPLDEDDDDMQPLAGDSDRISKIVKGLDGLARAQALRGALQPRLLELSPYLNSIVEEARQSFPGSDVTFNVECENGISMTADPECLAGIMTNLLDNAAKAVKHNGIVTVSALEKGDQIEFAIRDTGCGIRRKALPHIFERFYRGSGDGIGLGLTIVKELVDACKGTIAVQSTRGKGSVFTVSIPRS